MKFAADTGALLSLCCSEHTNSLLKEYEFFTTKAVLGELEQFALYSDYLGKHAQEMLMAIKAKKIATEEPKILLTLKISAAELSIFSLGKEKKYCILTDDLHAARVAQQELHIPSKPSFYALFLLYKEKKISKQQLLFAMDKIITDRNWMNGALYSYAKKLMEGL